jgi:RNA-dependent RNA polymerase
LAQLSCVLQTEDQERVSHVIALDTPPVYHRKLSDVASTFSDSENRWKAWDLWSRQTDIVHVQHELAQVPVSLRKRKPLVNIGK